MRRDGNQGDFHFRVGLEDLVKSRVRRKQHGEYVVVVIVRTELRFPN